MRKDAESILSEISTAFGGPNKQIISKWLNTPENERNQQDKLFGDSLKYYIKIYKKEVKNIFGIDKVDKSFYDKTIKEKILNVLSEKDSFNHQKELKERDSQSMAIDFLDENENSNVIITLPTGVGKTYVAFNEIEKFLKKDGKIFFAVPTNDLVKAQYDQFIDYIYMKGISIEESSIRYISKENKKLESSDKVVFLTHHMLEKISESDEAEDVNLIVIDEIHVGEEGNKELGGKTNYPSFNAYENLRNNKVSPKIIGLTAFSKQQEKVIEKFDIENWFVGSRKTDYNPREYLNHNLKEDNEFRNLQDSIDQSRIYVINKLEDLISKAYNLDGNSHDELLKYFSSSNLTSRTYIEKEYENRIKNYFRKRYQQKFSKEFYYFNILNFLLISLKSLNQIKKNLEADDYFIAKKKLENFLDKLNKDYYKYLSKQDDFKDKFYINEETRKYNHFMVNISYSIKTISNGIYKKICEVENNDFLHPKINKTFDIVEQNKIKGEPTIVFVENKEVIEKLMEVSRSKGFKAGYIIGGKRNKKEQFINSYIRQGIENKSIDVVFVTSVMKLGINFDINDIVLYNLPKNEKDLLQFVGRVGRFQKGGRAYFIYPKHTSEWYRSGIIKKAKRELEEQFNEGEKVWQNWLKYSNKSEFSKYVKNENYKKNGKFEFNKIGPETFIKDFYNGDLYDGQEIYGRFKIFEIKSDKENLILELEIGDCSSENTIKVCIYGFNSKNDMNTFKSNLFFDKFGENIYKINGIYNAKENNIIINALSSGGRVVSKCEEGTYDINDFETQMRLL